MSANTLLLGKAICDALGIDPTSVYKLTLTIEMGKTPEVVITRRIPISRDVEGFPLQLLKDSKPSVVVLDDYQSQPISIPHALSLDKGDYVIRVMRAPHPCPDTLLASFDGKQIRGQNGVKLGTLTNARIVDGYIVCDAHITIGG